MRQMCYFLCILFSCLGCNQPKEKIPRSEKELSHAKADSIRENSVVMTLEPREPTIGRLKEKAVLTISNNTGEPITTGESYSIEYLEDGRWKMLEVFKDLSFISIGYQISPGNTKEFKINFLAEQNNYREGEYRIIKNYTKERDTAPKTLHNVHFNFFVR